MEQSGREEGLSYDEVKSIFDHVHQQRKKHLGAEQKLPKASLVFCKQQGKLAMDLACHR